MKRKPLRKRPAERHGRVARDLPEAFEVRAYGLGYEIIYDQIHLDSSWRKTATTLRRFLERVEREYGRGARREAQRISEAGAARAREIYG